MNMKYEREREREREGLCLLVDRWSGKRIGGGPPLCVYVCVYEREREREREIEKREGWLVFLSLTLFLSFSMHFPSLTR